MPRDKGWALGSRLSITLLAASLLPVAVSGYTQPALDLAPRILEPLDIKVASSGSDDLIASNVSALTTRDAYSCSASAPCSNGACCGASGYCGYGPTYCGNGCLSQCDATAECGQYASEPGKQCPLNVCCSQYGFCGTTSDFCGTGCQSNCIQDPSPPAGGSGQVFDRVIGYWESWSNNKACHQVTPYDLPLDALTHINYAFAYIDPDTYQIVTMDSDTPSSLFDDITTLKSIKPDLEVWVSIGGWTFSDNGTSTQPVFGDIAADSGKRQTFSNNLVHFMQQHGFDGVDIDWEYPGAPDRGGRKEDTENYVEMLSTMRSTFDQSGGNYGITFTAPSSFWYLQWFDIPGLLKYANWVNFMTYDLHGVWDATDPIGSIVQGHTNLTEIKLAVELLWRVNVPPSKVSLGFGFYGRAFTLADTSCTAPGCPFSDASKPGPCTATAGYLGFYEIQQVLTSGAQPVHDTDAAVNYLVFDNDQWISYDDAVTFKQKTDWANSVGIGGSLIWASDLDDDKYTAHSDLLGRQIASTSSLQSTTDLLQKSKQLSLIETVNGQIGENCYTYSGDCQNLDDKQALANACGAGKVVVGWDDAGCGKKNYHYGKPICCPTLGAPTSCTWRGDNTGGIGGDCSAQCADGEVNIAGIGSSWGGGFTNDGDTNKCKRGYKAFCCVAPTFSTITKECSLTSCGSSCPFGQTAQFYMASDCLFGRTKSYCCPNPSPVSNCHWVGGNGGDCANLHCAANEVEIGRDSSTCSWGRSQPACCQVGEIDVEPATCSTDMCDAIPGYCDPLDGSDVSVLDRRDTSNDYSSEDLWKRGNPRTSSPPAGGPSVEVSSMRYPSKTVMYAGRAGTNAGRLALQAIPVAYRLAQQYCLGPSLTSIKIPMNPPASLLTGMEVEHVMDVQVIARSFLYSIFTGILPSGSLARLKTVGPTFFAVWNAANKGLTGNPIVQVGTYAVNGVTGPDPDTINDRIMTVLGSVQYRYALALLQKSVNIAKGNILAGKNPVAIQSITAFAKAAVASGTFKDADTLLSSIRPGFAVFEYLNQPQISLAWSNINLQMRTQLSIISQVTGVPNLVDWWDLWLADFCDHTSGQVQSWARDVLTQVTMILYNAEADAASRGLPPIANADQITAQLGVFADQISKLTFPGLYQFPQLMPPVSKRDLAGFGIWDLKSGQEDLGPYELDEEVWQRAMNGSRMVDVPEAPLHARDHSIRHRHHHGW